MNREYATLQDILESVTLAIREHGNKKKVGIFNAAGDLITASTNGKYPRIEMSDYEGEYLEFV